MPIHTRDAIRGELFDDVYASHDLSIVLPKYKIKIMYDGRGGIPGAVWTLKHNGEAPAFTLYDLADRLRMHGWQVPAYPLPADCEDLVVQRALVRHGVSRDLAKMLVEHIRSALEHFQKHPIITPMDRTEASGYHH